MSLAFKKATLSSADILPLVNYRHNGRKWGCRPEQTDARSYNGADEKQQAQAYGPAQVGDLHVTICCVSL